MLLSWGMGKMNCGMERFTAMKVRHCVTMEWKPFTISSDFDLECCERISIVNHGTVDNYENTALFTKM